MATYRVAIAAKEYHMVDYLLNNIFMLQCSQLELPNKWRHKNCSMKNKATYSQVLKLMNNLK